MTDLRRPLLLLATLLAGCGSAHDPGQAPLRRLTPTEYNRTVADLFGFDDVDAWPELEPAGDDWDDELAGPVWPQSLPPDIAVHGFEGMIEGQVASPYLAERYQAVALHFARFAVQAPYFWTCGNPSGLDTDARTACAADSIEKLAARAWRRALTSAEQQHLRAAFRSNLDGQDLDAAVTLTVAGLLSAPQFIYHIEHAAPRDDGREQLADWAMAGRLSYFLWDSIPDPTLFGAAHAGSLSTASALEQQARRMLKSPKAHEAIVHFHRQWLELDRIHSTRADLDTYAQRYAPEVYEVNGDFGAQDQEEVWSGALLGLRAGMVRETELFVEHTVFHGKGTLSALLTDHHGYITEVESFEGKQTTASAYLPTQIHDSHSYELELDDGNLGFNLTLRPATFPADQRSGLLTMGAVLAGHAHPVHPAPVQRGTFIIEQLTCSPIGQPPEGAEGLAPPDTLDAESTNRARIEAITQAPVCATCHEDINGAGFAFENFDSMGGWRDTDNGETVDASGRLTIPGEGVISFDGPVQLGQKLAASRSVHDCYALNWTRYALGRELGPDDDRALQQIQQRFWQTGGDVQELLVAIVRSDLFRTRTAVEGN